MRGAHQNQEPGVQAVRAPIHRLPVEPGPLVQDQLWPRTGAGPGPALGTLADLRPARVLDSKTPETDGDPRDGGATVAAAPASWRVFGGGV